jgi:glycosyltransferase involved in cell wall biosynthesis
VNLSRFEEAAARQNGNRKGSVSVGSWRNYGKAPHRVAEWGAANGGVDFYGGGMFAPGASREIPYESMPELLASYERFVFLPSVLEPFGRVVAEAWGAGCEIVTNDLVGAKWWITERPEAIETAAEDFWKVVLDA